MIISLTERCNEGCSHCFINSLPRSPIMNEETLDQVIAFLKRMQNHRVLISGGEFTEHPDFERFVLRIIDEARAPIGGKVCLLSNGSWFFDEEKKEKMLRLIPNPSVELVQIRTHQKYYPNYKRTWEAKAEMEALSEKLIVFDDGIKLVSLGRARANHKDEIEIKVPTCGNFFLVAKQGAASSFKDLVLYTEIALGKNCSPFISSQGGVHLGETPYCAIAGHVTDSDETLFGNVLTKVKPKNICGMAKNWPERAKDIIYKGIEDARV